MQIQDLYQLYLNHPSVQTDTRKLEGGDLFFALKGPHFNGNQFAGSALSLGASYAIVDEYEGPPEKRIIKVNDVLSTLQKLAGYHRQQFTASGTGQMVPFLAITGSNGKTTTKELVHAVLSTTYKTYTTAGNLNNHIGIPLSLLRIKKDAEIAVIEMGANHQKEIEGYCRYVMPTHGIITNCGKAHLEGFGGVEGVRRGKGELYDHLRAHEGTAFVMWDYDYLRTMSRGIPHILTYGTLDADVTGVEQESREFLEVMITKGAETGRIHTQLVGSYNLPNVLAAVAVGKHFNVPGNTIKAAIENYVPSNSRSQLLRKGTNRIILDAYNANPNSMKAAIENFANMEGENKILLLGSMMELGKDSLSEHQAVLDLIQKNNWLSVALVGSEFKNATPPFPCFETPEEAREWYRQQHFEHTLQLVKGSRATQMEKVLE